jgi:Coenzyme PQQ synthesis protein D (PqqD)
LSKEIPLSAIVVVADDVLSSELGTEHVLLNLRDGTYYGLDDVGSEIWKLLQKPVSIVAICDAIVETYDVNPEHCRHDVVRLLGELVERRLVDVRDSVARQ